MDTHLWKESRMNPKLPDPESLNLIFVIADAKEEDNECLQKD